MNIIITGASSGVGFEAALELIRSNENKVMAIARSADKLQRLSRIAKDLNPECTLIPTQFDIVHGDYEQGLIPFIQQKLGAVNILINNAGTLINKSFEQQDENDWYSMFEGNVLGHVRMIKHVLPLLEQPSHIVNIGSMGGFQGSVKFPGLSSYSASKAALHNLTECLAEELKEKNIKVNCLAIGSAQTEMLEKAFPDYQSPMQAFEMGKYIADFALTGHNFFNGKILPVAVTTP
jgi:short-subunit dehydrogenase